jgi:SAM-dependent methyltransferase
MCRLRVRVRPGPMAGHRDHGGLSVEPQEDLTVDRAASERVACPCCGSTDSESIHEQFLRLPDQYLLPNHFSIRCWRSCETGFSNFVGTDAGLAAFYSTGLDFRVALLEPEQSGERLANWWEVERLEMVAGAIVRQLSSGRARILDVGCSGGVLLGMLRQRGFSNAVGLEPSVAYSELARSHGLDVRVGSLADLPADLGLFDVIVLSHVLEHVRTPEDAIRALAAHLSASGLIYAEVPDAARYAEFAKLPFLDFNTEHINFFSLDTLDQLFGRCGFAQVSVGARDFLLFPGVRYPAVFGCWQPGNPAWPRVKAGNNQMRDRLRDYVQVSARLVERINQSFTAALGTRRNVAVRCLGNVAWTLLAVTRLKELNVVAYIDGSVAKRAFTFDGVSVSSPEATLPDDIPIVVLSLQHEAQVTREIRIREPEREVIGLSECLLESGG